MITEPIGYRAVREIAIEQEGSEVVYDAEFRQYIDRAAGNVVRITTA